MLQLPRLLKHLSTPLNNGLRHRVVRPPKTARPQLCLPLVMQLVILQQKQKKNTQKRSRPSPNKKVAKKLFTGEEAGNDSDESDDNAAH
ncbi:unnamed protein product [Urochloa humidicola]